MIKILFICHGNICRSPMAEFILKDMVKKLHKENTFIINSAATSTEEIGNPVYYAAKEKLDALSIDCRGKKAVQLTKKDYTAYDYIIAMEDVNIKNILKIVANDNDHKIYKLLYFAGGGNISDPWYTRNFDLAFDEIKKGCEGFLEYLKENGKL